LSSAMDEQVRQLGPAVGSLRIRKAFAESVSLGFNLFERKAPEAALEEAVTLF